ncbi:MAG: malate dehydrogenase [Leptospiraceae bacterium]|nr:malate dehydrogenase [Leptospiraceae bacterium]MCP5498521.1 malate dehydrogenase [Leptospiraceae bacterium]
MHDYKQNALDYHSKYPKGKLGVVPTKDTDTPEDLSLAYSPGVAYPCLEIQKDPNLAYEYTNKGNLVAVLTNGSAVLGLGNIGALAGKPVMEGKGVLFKKFAGVDVFDIELNVNSADELIKAVQMLEPTFGGINLEDIKAPECFYIEEKLIETMDIPVFHDDQHGTAIITLSAVINALEITNKKSENVKVVISGAGAAAIAITELLSHIGIQKENIFLVDSRGVINHSRTDLNEIKARYARKTNANTLSEIIIDADFFIGVSQKGLLTPEMVRTMADKPCIFAMANPDPEISYPDAMAARPDVIMGTGRSDYPNQINNLLGFPYIFRGALDVRARKITLEMKIAAARAIADLAREEVPKEIIEIYKRSFSYGKEYLIPKPFDSRVYYSVSSAVAEAAVKCGVARLPYPGREAYYKYLSSIKRG